MAFVLKLKSQSCATILVNLNVIIIMKIYKYIDLNNEIVLTVDLDVILIEYRSYIMILSCRLMIFYPVV